MSRHTPGPWEVSKHATPDYAPQFGIYAEGARNDLAIVKGDNAHADAVVMAAAPGLLRALIWAMPYAEAMHRAEYGEKDTETAASVLQAREALAKAIAI